MRTVVVGAGAAGLWSALHATERSDVVLVAPDPQRGSSTALAQGGIAAAVAEGDRPDAHARDTMAAGAGLCDPEAVRVLTTEAPAAIAELRSRGMAFDDAGAPTMEGGHTARRVLHAGGDATGWALLQALLHAVRTEPRIEWRETRVERLLTDGRRVTGVSTADGGHLETDRVIVCTGGGCGIFGRRTGPDRAMGQGMVLGWNVGAALADLEFVQFHPTALDVPGHPARLLSEALRGEGAVLLDADGRRFMDRFDPREELAPRDVVARAIVRVKEETGGRVFLDATSIDDVSQRFPTVAASCREAGLDLATDRIPVAPAAHYFTGGLWTDVSGRTTVPGLSAVGEAACTGVHGANRLASNSLLEALVFGRRAALAEEGARAAPQVEDALAGRHPGRGLALDEIRSLADAYLGVVRTGPDLEAVAAKIGDGSDAGADPEASLVAWLVATAALRRTESRGGHYRSDAPMTLPRWQVRQVVNRDGWAQVPVS
jgi:L-aspartate oxidase